MLHRSLAALAPAFLAASCVTTNEADLHEYFQNRGLEVTQSEAPEGARPLEVISYYKSGFYLFGVLPVVSVELADAVDWVTATAERLGADGIANLSFQYSPASFWKFTLFPLPDWSSWIHVSGMAYALPAEGDESAERVSAVDLESFGVSPEGKSVTISPIDHFRSLKMAEGLFAPE